MTIEFKSPPAYDERTTVWAEVVEGQMTFVFRIAGRSVRVAEEDAVALAAYINRKVAD